jgi:hypothetical protein
MAGAPGKMFVFRPTPVGATCHHIWYARSERDELFPIKCSKRNRWKGVAAPAHIESGSLVWVFSTLAF